MNRTWASSGRRDLLLVLLLFASGVSGALPSPLRIPGGGRATAQEAAAEAPLADDMETPRGVALGTGARATSTSTSALMYNPAAMARAKVYHLEGFGAYESSPDQYSFGASVVDSVTNVLAAGLGLRGITSGEDGARSGLDGRLGLAVPFSPAVGFGLAGRYLNLNREVPSADGNELGSERIARGFTLDASINVSLTEQFQLAALGQNLIDMDTPYAPQLVGAGAGAQLGALGLGVDLLFDLSTFERAKPIVGGGLEFMTSAKVPLRFGYEYHDGSGRHDISGGLGFIEEQFGLNVSMRQQVSGGSQTLVMGSLQYFVQ